MNSLRKGVASVFAAASVVFAVPEMSGAIEPDQVLVVVNDASPISIAIGDYYQQVRGIPAGNVFHLPVGTSTSETVSRTVYNTSLRDPIKDYLTSQGLRFQILCLVTTKGVPLRVSSGDAVGLNQLRASVDSELGLMFTGQVPDGGQEGWVGNPYFDSSLSFENFRSTGSLYLVARLTGYQTDVDPGTGVPGDIKALIDRGQLPAGAGTYLLDADPLAFQQGNGWLVEARDELQDLGASVSYDPTQTFQCNVAGIRGYAGWGSNDGADPGAPYYGEVPASSGNLYPGVFVNGALTTTFVSTSARTFTDGSQNYGQSLIADLIRHGATGCSGHVYEPFLDAVPRPQILFHRWETGFQAAEAFAAATPYLSWENVLVVDPLARVAEFDPPSLTSVSPSSGPILGGESVTLVGDSFYGQAEVFFGGVPAGQLNRIGPQELRVVVPAGVSLGEVDVRIETPYGEVTLAGGYEYEELAPNLFIRGTACLGCTIRFEIRGPIGARAALLLDAQPGTTKVSSLCFGLAFSPNLRIVYDGIRGVEENLSFPGELLVPFRIPNDSNLLFRTFYGQAVLRRPTGELLVTNTVASSIFP